MSLSSTLKRSVLTRGGGHAASGEAQKVSTHLVFPVLLSACFETGEETEKKRGHYTKCCRINYFFGQGAVQLNGLKISCWVETGSIAPEDTV